MSGVLSGKRGKQRERVKRRERNAKRKDEIIDKGEQKREERRKKETKTGGQEILQGKIGRRSVSVALRCQCALMASLLFICVCVWCGVCVGEWWRVWDSTVVSEDEINGAANNADVPDKLHRPSQPLPLLSSSGRWGGGGLRPLN